MRPRALALVAALIASCATESAVLGNTTWRKRKLARDLVAEVHAPDRYVDIGVELVTVVADPNGAELIPGRPKLRAIASRTFGGVLDTKLVTPMLVGPTQDPQRWYCSTDQEPVVIHADTDPLGQVAYGSMGAGKTTALVQWTYCRWLEQLGAFAEGGITAPTETRLDLVLTEFRAMFPPSWYTHRVAEGVLELVDGTRLRLVSTYRQSAAQGSRIQGFNWSFAARDEGQDQTAEHEHIEGRLRSARGGRAKQLITATAKDDPDWRTLRDQLDAARDSNGRPLWLRRTLYGKNSPFVHPSHWDRLRATMSPRRFAQIAEARDVGPERATYPAWSRETNLITIPELGWEDVTTRELRGSGDNLAMLAGHDPGSLFDVSIFLRAFKQHPKQQRPIWVVVGELTTEESTTEQHITRLLSLVRERWRLNLLDHTGRVAEYGPRLLVRADPAGNTDNRTDRSVYTLFRNAGIAIKPAAYNADGDGHGRVPKDPGIELVNTLLCNAAGERRLFVARNADGSPCAPRLVAALESSERDLDGKAETQRKTKQDVSHWPAALRYALWAIERPRLALVSSDRADERGRR